MMKEITVTPKLLRLYSKLHKNDLLLHMFIKANADENGRVKRNVLQFSKQIGITEQRVRDAEYRNKQNGLLRIHWRGKSRFWYVYDEPVTQSDKTDSTPVAQPVVQKPDEQVSKRRGLFSRIRDLFGLRGK